MKFSFRFFLVLMLTCASLVSIASNTMYRLRLNTLTSKWQYVFDLNAPPSYRSFTLKNPLRLVVDFNDTLWRGSQLKSNLWRHTNVADIRLAERAGDKLRFVFDLKNLPAYQIQMLKPQGHRGNRLVLNFHRANTSASHFKSSFEAKAKAFIDSHLPKAKTTTKNATAQTPKLSPTSIQTPQGHRRIVVVIDPGHGGKDPGATGPRGSHEKKVVLAIARYLQADINKLPGFKAVLTRKSDYFVPLRGRLAIARKYKADMFISIHADAFIRRSARGASVFALSQRGATSEAARWLAKRENESELMGGVDLNDKNHVLKSVLIDLSQTAAIGASLKIGHGIIKSLKRVTPMHHDRVEQAAFVVLKSPDIPSLLVETGFISNPEEERNLNSRRHQRRLAQALTQGIRNYFEAHPPRGTWLFAHRADKRRYVVASGDTLSQIAVRFGVSVKSIESMNHLGNKHLRIGQVLYIPVYGA